jgi:flavin reductase (DIM6/NTAB) family NADH-FMN oxidoreductase RutF
VAELDLAALSPRERYRILAALIAPRPIAFVSSLDASGRGNLAPFSCFAMGGIDPLSCVVCAVAGRGGADKDTTRNILETGEYVVNVVTHAMAGRMNAASFAYDAGDDEFERCGLTRVPSLRVRPPRVAESPAQLECRLFQVVRHGSGAGASVYLVGEVVHIAAADDVCTDGVPDNRKLEHLARLGGDWYLSVRPEQLFAMSRPTAP